MTISKEGVFDISDAEGVNDSERLLMRLCRKSFLSLWSHANLHTDQDIRDGKGSAKEFADVLVVFGDDIIIFSDKCISFQTEKPIEIAWARWYKKAILASANQLQGALNWLKRFPNRIFIDPKCSRTLPIEIPPPERARYHLIAITRGSFSPCAKHFPGSLGTHQINTSVTGKPHEETPFTVGIIDLERPFIHVFDEYSLEVLMDEFDTIADFLDYIKSRQEFLTNKNATIIAAGEEQLIAAYISNGDESGGSFIPKEATEKFELAVFDESHLPALKARPEYIEMRNLNSQSKFWDELRMV